MQRRNRLAVTVLALLASGMVNNAPADEIAEFYKGNTITLVIGSAAGGGYDIYARLIDRHMARHIPGKPNIISQNMPGAGSINAANHVYNNAKQDGTVITALNRTAAFAPIFGEKGPRFDPVKFQWLGSLNNEAGVIRVRIDTGVKSIADARTAELTLGTTAPGTDTAIYPALLNNTLGTRFRTASGYPSGPAIDLAIERNEVHGQTDSVSSMQTRWPAWRTQFHVLAQLSLTPHPDLTGIPLILDIVKTGPLAPGFTTEEAETYWRLMLTQKVMGRPFALGPAVPASRVKALRDAFRAMLTDTDFIADAKRQKREVLAVEGEAIQEMIAKVAAAPAATITKLNDLLKPPQRK